MRDACVLFTSMNSLTRKELLEKDGSLSIHMRNIQSLVIEMFSVSRNLSPRIKNVIFKQKKQKNDSWYNLRQISEFSKR